MDDPLVAEPPDAAVLLPAEGAGHRIIHATELVLIDHRPDGGVGFVGVPDLQALNVCREAIHKPVVDLRIDDDAVSAYTNW